MRGRSDFIKSLPEGLVKTFKEAKESRSLSYFYEYI